MYDPLIVAFEIRRPPLTVRELRGSEVRPTPAHDELPREQRSRHAGPVIIRAKQHSCFDCKGTGKPTREEDEGYSRCRACAGRGHHRTGLWRRLFVTPFWRMFGREWFCPSVVTVWHRDAEHGHDDSCSDFSKQKMLEAKADNRYVAAAWWTWMWRTTPKRHVHHWRLQVRPLQNVRRWLLTRCETCGGRFRYGESPVGKWHHEKRRWWQGEEGMRHMKCSGLEKTAARAKAAGA